MSIGAWEPFWLDEESRGLYAALHRPASTRGSAGVVFVPPLLHELPRSRRFVAEVASGLSALGLPCLRFDFFGTGESSGSGDRLDFASMHADLDLAVAALRDRTGVDRVVLLAWRSAALPLSSWLKARPGMDMVVLWEPIVDGASWLNELEHEDASERSHRPSPRPGVPRTARADDGQLMGFAASQRLRRELAHARLVDWPRLHDIPTWAVLRPQVSLPIELARVLSLPESAPTFGGGASMEATFFLSPPLERLVDELGRTLLGHAWPGRAPRASAPLEQARLAPVPLEQAPLEQASR